ncbi:MAG: TRAP transporter small permease [Silicimonas sp.]|nr:TRAP transporter small permease [Silicimonas sp.]
MIDRLVTLMAIAAGLVLSGLVALTFFDVLMRYLVSAPLRGRQDIVEMGMVVVLMLSAPYTWRISGHISVDLYDALPFRSLEILRSLLVRVIVAALFALIAWRSVEALEDAALFNEATNMIQIPHTPFIWIILGSCLLHAAILVFETISQIRALFDDGSGESPVQ